MKAHQLRAARRAQHFAQRMASYADLLAILVVILVSLGLVPAIIALATRVPA